MSFFIIIPREINQGVQIFYQQDSLSIVMVDWDKHKMQLVHLGEKVIQLDS